MITGRFEDIFEQLTPEELIDPTARKVDQAAITFPGRAVTVESREELADYLAAFACHLENTVLGITPPRAVWPAQDWGRCSRMLRNRYGRDAADDALYDAQWGTNGGLRGILDLIAEGHVDHFARNVINCRVSDLLRPLTVEASYALALAYIEHFSHLLPPQYLEGKGMRVCLHLKKILENHPFIVRRARLGLHGQRITP